MSILKKYTDDELTQESTIRKFRIVQTEGLRQVSREVIHYNQQVIIAVGFKVNNERAVRLRKWAGQIARDYTIQGWTMDKERLKKGHMFTDEYFERQLDQIVEHIVHNGMVKALSILQEPPFTDRGSVAEILFA